MEDSSPTVLHETPMFCGSLRTATASGAGWRTLVMNLPKRLCRAQTVARALPKFLRLSDNDFLAVHQ